MTDTMFKELISAFAHFNGMTEDEILAEVQRRAAITRKRMANKNARYAAAVARITDKQAMRITQREANGFTFNCIYQNKTTGNVAVMLFKAQVYNPMTQKVGGKTMFVYPDGHTNEAYGNKCSLEQTF